MYGVPQGSVLEPILFIIFINDLHVSIKNSKVHHFAYDTNLLLINKSLKQINKLINHDLSLLVQWLRLNTSSTVNYLGVLLHENLQWQTHIDSLITKLSRAVGLLSKIRYDVPKYLLSTIYFSIFNSHMIYNYQVREQNEAKIKQISELQDKALRIINFKPKNHPVPQLYKSNKILKLTDYIKLLNCMFVKDTLSANQIPIFNNFLKKPSEIHRYNPRHTSRNTVELPQPITERYVRYSVRFQAATTWNNLQNIIPIDMLSENYSIVSNCC